MCFTWWKDNALDLLTVDVEPFLSNLYNFRAYLFIELTCYEIKLIYIKLFLHNVSPICC